MAFVKFFSLEAERPEIEPPVFEIMHRVILVLIWVFIFHNPFPIVESVKEICYYTGAVFFLVLIVTRKINVRFDTPLAIPFALYTGWVLIGLFFALDKPGSLHDFGAHLLKNIWLYYILCYYFDSRERLMALGWTVIVAAFIFSAVSLTYFYGYLGHNLLYRFGTGFPHAQTNVIGFTTVFASLLAYHYLRFAKDSRRRFFLVAALAVTMAASVLTQSRGTLLAIVVSFFFLSRHKILYAAIVLSLIGFILVSPMRQVIGDPKNYYSRLYPAYFSIELIKDYPLTGTGYSLDALKNHDLIDPELYEPRLPAAVKDPQNIWPHSMVFILPHSMLLNIPVRTGLPGLLLYGFILFVFAKESWRLYRKGSDTFIRSWALLCLAAMAMHFTKGVFEPVDTAMVEVILFTIFAMLTITGIQEERVAERPAEVDSRHGRLSPATAPGKTAPELPGKSD